jgi:hypothetical protein
MSMFIEALCANCQPRMEMESVERMKIEQFSEKPDMVFDFPDMAIVVKGFDQQDIDRHFVRDQVRCDTIGSSRTAERRTRVGDVLFMSPTPVMEFDFYRRENVRRLSDIFKLQGWGDEPAEIDYLHNLINPRNFTQFEGKHYIGGHNQIVIFDPINHKLIVHYYRGNGLSTTHDLDIDPVKRMIVTANAGTDTVTFLSVESMDIISRYTFRDHGYNFSLDGETDFSLKKSRDLVDLPTSKQTAHPNSVLFDRDHGGIVWVTLFGVNSKSILGDRKNNPRGQLVRLCTDEHYNVAYTNQVLMGLANPHDFQHFGSGQYLMCDTSADLVLILKETSLGEGLKVKSIIDFKNVDRTGSDRIWLQSTTLFGEKMITVDSGRKKIHLLNLKTKERAEIKIDDPNLVIQKAYPLDEIPSITATKLELVEHNPNI